MKRKKIWGILIFLALLAATAAVIMLLWNALLPIIFGTVVINYWQALGLLVLARILFGRWGAPFMGAHRHFHHHKDHHLMHQQMKGMSREERIEFIRNRMNGEPRNEQ